MQIPYLNQILLFLVVTVLTVLLTIAGIQVIHILSEVRQAMKKLNHMMEDFQLISSSVAKPIAGISGFVTGLKSSTELINYFFKGQPIKRELGVKKSE
jgi:hypothetical protein